MLRAKTEVSVGGQAGRGAAEHQQQPHDHALGADPAERRPAAAFLDPLTVQGVHDHAGSGLPVESEPGQLLDDLGRAFARARQAVDIAL